MSLGAMIPPPASDSPTVAKPKKAKRKSPTQHSLDKFRAMGCTAQKVEHWQMAPGRPGGGVRVDLFGCIDLIVLIDFKIVGIQCGAYSGHSGHKKKCLAEPRLKEWLQSGGRMLLHSWQQKGGKGTPWTLREEELTIADFATTGELGLC